MFIACLFTACLIDYKRPFGKATERNFRCQRTMQTKAINKVEVLIRQKAERLALRDLRLNRGRKSRVRGRMLAGIAIFLSRNTVRPITHCGSATLKFPAMCWQTKRESSPIAVFNAALEWLKVAVRSDWPI